MNPSNPQGNFRIYYQNVNGVTTRQGTGKWNKINEFMHTNNIAIYGLTKTNVEWNNQKTTARLKALVRKRFSHTTIATSTSTMQFKENYKPGGTCTIAVKQWSGRTVQTITDTSGQGQWRGIKIRGH
jgi:hypothetical protein